MINNPVWIVDQTDSTRFKQLIDSFVGAHNLTTENVDDQTFSAMKIIDNNSSSGNAWVNYHCLKKFDKTVITKIADQFFSNGHEFSYRSDIVIQNSTNKTNLNFDVHFVLDIEISSSDILENIKLLKEQYIDTNKWTSQTRFYIHVLIPFLTNQSTPKDSALLPKLNNFIDQKVLGDSLLGGVFLYHTDNNKEFKDDIYSEVLISISTISGGETRFIDELHKQFTNNNPIPIYQTSAAGVFLEDEVYKEKQAFILSKLISGTLNEGEGVFCNEDKAKEKANVINLEKLDGNNLTKKSDRELFPELRNKIINTDSKGWIKYWNHPKNQLNFYFKGFLAKLKFNLINQVSGVLEDEYRDYEKKAVRQKEINIQSISKNLDEEIFKVLDAKPINTLNQCYAVADKLHIRLKDEYVGNEKVLQKKDEELNKIYKNYDINQLDADKIEEAKNQLLQEISTLVKDHPIIFWAALSRVTLITFLLCVLSSYLGAPVVAIFNLGLENYPWIPGLLISFVPVFMVLRNQSKRTKNILERIEKYIAFSIEELNQRVEKLNKRHIQDTRSAVLAYLEWVKEDKIKGRLINGIKDVIFEPKEYAFTVKSKVNIPSLQPIYDLPVDSNKTGSFTMPQSKSADFSVARNNPILNNDLMEKMSPQIEINSQKVTFTDLFEDNSDLINILPEYYDFEVEVDKLYQDAAIVKEQPKRYLLVLDVSGSMTEEIDFKNSRKSKYEALKSTIKDLDKDGLELKYISFSTKSELIDDIDKLPKPNGVTNLPSAFDLIKNEVANFDKVILVSDGQPTDSEGQILSDNDKLNLQKVAFGIGKPLDVIYIGETNDKGADFMENLAIITGGNYYTENIDSLKNCIEQGFKIFYRVDDKKRKLPIRKLLESGNKEACIYGLFAFCKSKVDKTSITLVTCIEEMLNSKAFDGYKTFIQYSEDFPDLKSGSKPNDMTLFNSSTIKDKIENRINNELPPGTSIQFIEYMNDYKYIHSVIGLRQINQISDIQLNADWGIKFDN